LSKGNLPAAPLRAQAARLIVTLCACTCRAWPLSQDPMKSFACLLALSASAATACADLAVKDGEKIGFLGDSITQGGWSNAQGYVKLVVSGLEANGVKVEPIPAGISGNKSNQMLERVDRDVLSKKPNWMTLSCGVNDVWHGVKGVPLDEYAQNIRAIVDKASAAGAKVVLLTSTPIGENPNFGVNLAGGIYNETLRKIAAEKKLPVADLASAFWAELKTKGVPGKNVLTTDGVHMNPEGNKIMARGVLKALGANEAELKKAEDAWTAAAPK
jgi:lysophospholipase L1-like esterase